MANGKLKLGNIQVTNAPTVAQDVTPKSYVDGLVLSGPQGPQGPAGAAGTLISFIPFSASEYTITTSLVNVPGLSVSGLVAAKTYKVELDMFIRSVGSGHSVTGDLAGGSATMTNVQWNFEAFFTGEYGIINTNLATVNSQLDVFGASLASVYGASTGSGGGNVLFRLTGIMTVNAGGTFQPRITTDSGASGAVLCVGCMMILTPLN